MKSPLSSSAPFSGHLFESCRSIELPEAPIDQHVNIYSSGRSDEIQTTKLPEYPIKELPYDGHVFVSKFQSDLALLPLEVEKKHIGFYESPKTHESKPGAMEKLTQLFKRSKTIEEYPVDSEPYFGQIDSTKVVTELKEEAIHSLVSIYSTGHYDENETKLTKITDFPKIEEPFIGYMSEVERQSELDSVPFDVERRHIGYYEYHPLTIEEKKPETLQSRQIIGILVKNIKLWLVTKNVMSIEKSDIFTNLIFLG